MEKVVAKTSTFTVYQYEIKKVGTYYLSVPTGDVDKYDIFIGFPNKELTALSSNEVVSEFNKTAEMVTSLYRGIYVMPVIPYDQLIEAAHENDDIMFSEIWWNIVTPITTEIYIRFNGNFNDKRNLIVQGDGDRKLIDWIDIECSRFGKNLIGEIKYSDLIKRYNQDKKVDNVILEDSPTLSEQSNGGIAPMNHEFDNTGNKNKPYTRSLEKTKNTSPGFSSFKFIVITLLISLVTGISIGYLLIK